MNRVVILLFVLIAGLSASTSIAEEVDSLPSGSQLHLTAHERAWLATHPKIIVGGEMGWAPFDFVDKSGEYVGIANDYLIIISAELGIEIEVSTGYSWKKLADMLQNKEIDLLPALYFSKEREEYVHYTIPYMKVSEFIYARDDAQGISSIDDLKGKRVAVVKGYTIEGGLRSDYPEINLVTVPNTLVAMGSNSGFVTIPS
jgi:two-component system sensor histidine kinase EvgS